MALIRPCLFFVLSVVALTACDSDDRRVGADDPAARASCGAATGTPVTAAASEAAAADAVIELPATELVPRHYSVTLPEGAESYAVLRVSTMHNDIALFVDAQDMIVHLAPDGVPSSLRHGSCPDSLVDDYRTHVHAPGDYRITFAAEGPRQVQLAVVLAELGHGDGGMHEHDGGAHEHDGGMHEHDGGAHEHDGGMHEHDGGTHEHDGGAHEHDGGTHEHDGGHAADAG